MDVEKIKVYDYNSNKGQRKSKTKCSIGTGSFWDIFCKKNRPQSEKKKGATMRISDIIEEFIKDLFNNEEEIEIQRNDLAQKVNCVPSQINYVISTRFKPSQGYYVESRRGGGGHITIKKISNTRSDYLMHIIENIGDTLQNSEADILISDFLTYNLVNNKEAKLLKVATSDNVLDVPKEYRDKLRASILKNMLLNIE